MTVRPPHAVFTVHDRPDGIVVQMPSPRRPVTALVVALWLVGWAVGLAFAQQQFRGGDTFGPDRLFLLGWSLAWFVAGLLAIVYLVWLLAGRERVTLLGGRLGIWRGVWRFGVAHEYAAADVYELRTFGRDVVPLLAVGLDVAGQGASGVRFRCCGRVVRFARALDEPAAHALVDRLRACLPLGGHAGAPVEPAA